MLAAASSTPLTFAAGALSRVGRDVLLHPLDTVKTRQQTPSDGRSSLGIRSLYSGLGPVLLCGVPAGGTYFALNAAVLDACSNSPLLAGSAKVIAATCAATGLWAIRTPGEVIKTRAQAELGGVQPAATRTAAILREGGVGALWLGFGQTLTRSVPYEVLRLNVYAWLLSEFGRGDAAACGLAAGTVAALLTQPLDVIKTRRQTAEQVASDGDAAEALGPLAVVRSAREIIDEAGGSPAALFSGWSARCASSALSSAVVFGLYERILDVLQQAQL